MKNSTLRFKSEKCDFCGSCVAVCEPDALFLTDTSMTIDNDKCTRCARCTIICPFRALVLESLL